MKELPRQVHRQQKYNSLNFVSIWGFFIKYLDYSIQFYEEEMICAKWSQMFKCSLDTFQDFLIA